MHTAIGVVVIVLALLVEVATGAPIVPGKKISLNVHKADIRTVLHYLAEMSGFNIVVGPDVKGTITVHLKDVLWEQALGAILTHTGLTQERQGNIILVMPTAQSIRAQRVALEAELRITRVVPVKYRDAAELGAILEHQLGACAAVSVNVRTNTLIITGTPSCLRFRK